MKKSEKTLQDLNNVQEDLNKILSLIEGLNEIDEDTDLNKQDYNFRQSLPPWNLDYLEFSPYQY